MPKITSKDCSIAISNWFELNYKDLDIINPDYPYESLKIKQSDYGRTHKIKHDDITYRVFTPSFVLFLKKKNWMDYFLVVEKDQTIVGISIGTIKHEGEFIIEKMVKGERKEDCFAKDVFVSHDNKYTVNLFQEKYLNKIIRTAPSGSVFSKKIGITSYK